MQEAIENNLSLLAERYNLSIAEAKMITARLRPNPVVSMGGDHLDWLGTGFNEQNGAGPPEYFIRTDFLIERGGKRRSRIEVAEQAREVARWQLLNATRTIVLEVQMAFVDVLLAKSNLALAEENLRLFNQIVQVNAARVNAGDLAPVELTRTRLAALQLQNAVMQAQSRLRLARQRLQGLMGRTVLSETFDVIGELRRDLVPVSLEVIEQQALNLRPDLQALKREQARALAEVRLQLAYGKADYSFGIEVRRQQGIAGKGNSIGVFFSLPLPIFNRNQGEIERARQELAQIEARLRALEADIRNEVRSAFQQCETARSLLTTIEADMLQQARQVLRTMEYSYRRGEASFVELLDAQRAFNDTMQSYNEARAEYARCLYLIDSISGKGLNQ
ncbi:MAG: TolC family protein [Blastocatellia bacterium]|nr:TolC family protein [Blastocatellia bacterium]MCS7156763.1 TolC family protein [Blastocatellia bacterium]MCX7752721.1 TolC family protein [Blastocatellia bacterium]MDW8167453.1 TolC family protein [Acidobacteriota bacterium]MDW8256800.1 TolC family protein [Acidobacteriota bacterium]